MPTVEKVKELDWMLERSRNQVGWMLERSRNWIGCWKGQGIKWVCLLVEVIQTGGGISGILGSHYCTPYRGDHRRQVRSSFLTDFKIKTQAVANPAECEWREGNM